MSGLTGGARPLLNYVRRGAIRRRWGAAAAKPPRRAWSIVRGDRVALLAVRGAAVGASGVVTRVLRRRNRVVVAGLNTTVRAVKPPPPGSPPDAPPGGLIAMESPIAVSRVALLDPADG